MTISLKARAQRAQYWFWYRWISNETRTKLVALLRPFNEMRMPCDLKSVNLGGHREVLGQVKLDRLEAWVTWKKFSYRDLRAIRQEIARKRVLKVMQAQYGYPTDAEIREYYKQSAVGKKTPAERKAFAARLAIKP